MSAQGELCSTIRVLLLQNCVYPKEKQKRSAVPGGIVNTVVPQKTFKPPPKGAVWLPGQPSSKDQIKRAFCFTWPQKSPLSAGGGRGRNAKPKSKRTASLGFCTILVLRLCLHSRPEAKKLMPINFVGVYCHRVNSSNQKYSAVLKSLSNPWALNTTPAGQRLCSHGDRVALHAQPESARSLLRSAALPRCRGSVPAGCRRGFLPEKKPATPDGLNKGLVFLPQRGAFSASAQ